MLTGMNGYNPEIVDYIYASIIWMEGDTITQRIKSIMV